MKENETEILVLTSRVLETLVIRVRKAIPWFNRCSETIALLDMLCSFAAYSVDTVGCTKPILGDDGAIAIREGFHPILFNRFPDKAVSNSALLRKEQQGSNCLLVIGSNNTGKVRLLISPSSSLRAPWF